MEPSVKEAHTPVPYSQAGVALIEFAFVVPVLILLLLGLVEIGRFAYYSIVVGNAARAGVQYGAQTLATAQDSTGMANAAKNDGQNNIANLTASPAPTHFCQCWDGTTATSDATCSPTCATGHRVVYVQVTTSGTFSPLFNYPKLPSSFSVSSTATMRVINQ